MINNAKNKKKKKGFTIIELIIVIAIIAILAAISIPKFVDVRENAAKKTDIANAKTIASAAATLYANGDITNEASGSEVIKIASPLTNGNKIANYLQSIPKTEAVHGEVDKEASFYIAIDGGNVEVYAGEKTSAERLYPENESE